MAREVSWDRDRRKPKQDQTRGRKHGFSSIVQSVFHSGLLMEISLPPTYSSASLTSKRDHRLFGIVYLGVGWGKDASPFYIESRFVRYWFFA